MPGPPVNSKQASTDQQVSGQRRISQARAIDRMSVLCRLPRGCSVGTQLRRWQHQASHFYDMLEAMVWALRRIGTCAYHRTTSRMRAWRFNATGLNYLGRRKLQKRCHDDPHLMEWNRQNIPYWAQKHALAAGHSADLLSKAAPQVDSSPHTPDLPTLRFAGVTPVSGRVTHPELTPLDLGPGVQLTGKYRPTATDDRTPTRSASDPAAQETAQEQVQVRLTKIAAHQQLQLSRAPITRRPSDQGDYSAPQLPHRATLRINTSAQAPAQAHRHRHTGTGAQAQHYSNSTATGRPSDRGDYSALQLPHGATLRIDTSAVQVLTQAQTARHPHRNSTGTSQEQHRHSKHTGTAQDNNSGTAHQEAIQAPPTPAALQPVFLQQRVCRQLNQLLLLHIPWGSAMRNSRRHSTQEPKTRKDPPLYLPHSPITHPTKEIIFTPHQEDTSHGVFDRG